MHKAQDYSFGRYIGGGGFNISWLLPEMHS
jgi:hypothetical protein